MYGGLFLSFIMDSFDQVQKFGAMPLQLSAFYLKRLQEPMGAKGKKISSFFLTKYIDNPFFVLFFIIWLLIFFETGDYNLLTVSPVTIYPNADTDKLQILSDNKDKSGIYCFTNLINGKKYVGSSVDLRGRFYQYFNLKYLTSTTSMPICSALLKYGYSNFSLEILEYCEPSECIEREKYYIDLLLSEYNIIQDPTLSPMLGRKHSKETIAKLR